MHPFPTLRLLAALAVMAASPLVHAQAISAQTAVVSASTKVSPQPPANHEHPAVTAWREAQLHPQPMDPNHMLVQPPASVTWKVLPEDADLPLRRTAQR